MNMRIVLSYLIVYAVWGTSMLATRFLVNDTDVIWGFALRYLGATTLLTIAVLLYRPFRKSLRPSKQELLNAFLTGLILLVAAILLRAFSLQSISSGELGIMSALTPLFIALFAWQMSGCKPARHHILGGTLGIIGTIILSLDKINSDNGPDYGTGIFLALTGVIVWAFGTVLQKLIQHPESTISRVLFQNLAAAISLSLLGFLTAGDPLLIVANWQHQTILSFIHLTVFGSTISTVAYMYLLKNEPLLRVSTTSFVIPIIAVFAGYALGGEVISTSVLFALSISLFGTIIAMWGPQIYRQSTQFRLARLKIGSRTQFENS